MGVAIGRVVSVNISERKGTRKKAVPEGRFLRDLGLVGDAHSGPGIRQVSLLAAESIARQQRIFDERRGGRAKGSVCPKAHAGGPDNLFVGVAKPQEVDGNDVNQGNPLVLAKATTRRGELSGPPTTADEDFRLGPGSFAENLTIEGIDLPRLPIGTKLKIGDEVEMEITKIGKECHVGCEIFKMLGNCVMPREGVFARVVVEGEIRQGDKVEVVCE